MEPVSIVIVAYPGPLRDGLRILFKTVKSVGAIEVVDNADLLLSRPWLVGTGLMVWDWNYLQEDAQRLITQVRSRWPETRTLALVTDDEQGEWALLAGVDAVLTKGTSIPQLLTTIADLLPKAPATPEPGSVHLTGSHDWNERPSAPFTPLILPLPIQA